MTKSALRAAGSFRISFGSADVYPRARELRVDGNLVEINNFAFEILLMLIEADGQIVTKKELFQRLWPETYVGETNLRVHIHKLRGALGENGKAVQTASNRGYRLTALLARSPEENLQSDVVSRTRPEATACSRSRASTVVVIVDRDEGVRAALDVLLGSVRRIIENHPPLREHASENCAPDCAILTVTLESCSAFEALNGPNRVHLCSQSVGEGDPSRTDKPTNLAGSRSPPAE